MLFINHHWIVNVCIPEEIARWLNQIHKEVGIRLLGQDHTSKYVFRDKNGVIHNTKQ